MNKLILFFFLVGVLCFSFFPLSSAVDSLVVASYSGLPTFSTHYFYTQHPSASGSAEYKSAIGEAFIANNTEYLYSVDFLLSRTGIVKIGNLTARLYSVTGTVGTNAVPNELLVSSEVLSSVVLQETNASLTYNNASWVTFDFDGSYQMVNGSSYAVSVELTNWVGGTTYDFCVDYYYNVGVAGLNSIGFTNSAWYANTDDYYFIVNGNEIPPVPTPTPSPAPSSSSVSSSASIPTVYLLFLLIGAVIAVMLGLFKVFEGEDNRPLKLLLVLVGLILFIVVFMWLVVALGI